MARAEYTIIHSKYFPPNIRASYQIGGLVSSDGYVYIKIVIGMYRLKHADIIACDQLISHMEPHVY